jgi:DNA-binding response OmpR family regulator
VVKALLIDDDIELAELMHVVLTKYSIDLDTAHTPDEGFKALETNEYDIVLLDIMLPMMNGLQMCQRIRYSNAVYRDVSIIMLTARTDLTDMVVGLETGADDYVKKPFEPRELVARINAVLRRRGNSGEEREIEATPVSPESAQAQAGGARQLFLDGNVLTIDPQRAQVMVNGARLTITSMEFELIASMAESPSEILSRDALLSRVHGSNVVYTRSIDALIYRLRNKIKDAGSGADFIRTVRGRGYSLVGTLTEQPH